MINWTLSGPPALASFMASLVEFVEALTVVLAVGTVRGWRPALIGTATALALLTLLVLLLGPSMTRIPLAIAQLLIGTLLLMFGLRWLRKAILRYAGVIPMHDEEAEFRQESELMRRSSPRRHRRWDQIAFAAAFKIVMLEGIEVVFIVVAIGASGRLIVPAAAGALGALLTVAALGLWLHRPLARVPENALKFGVGVLLAAFGTYWVGEGISLRWPGGDAMLAILIAAYFVTARLLVRLCRSYRDPILKRVTKVKTRVPGHPLRLMLAELLALFVDDLRLALGVLLWAALNWAGPTLPQRFALLRVGAFAAGFLTLLTYSSLRAVRRNREPGPAA